MKKTCAEICKEMSDGFRLMPNANDRISDWIGAIRSCSDFPIDPEVIEWTVDFSHGGTLELKSMHGKKWSITATEIIEDKDKL